MATPLARGREQGAGSFTQSARGVAEKSQDICPQISPLDADEQVNGIPSQRTEPQTLASGFEPHTPSNE